MKFALVFVAALAGVCHGTNLRQTVEEKMSFSCEPGTHGDWPKCCPDGSTGDWPLCNSPNMPMPDVPDMPDVGHPGMPGLTCPPGSPEGAVWPVCTIPADCATNPDTQAKYCCVTDANECSPGCASVTSMTISNGKCCGKCDNVVIH